MGEILIPRRTKVEKGYELLADITVGTATTSVDITGLNIGKGDEVVLVAELNNTTGLNSDCYISFNSNTTQTQYYTQFLNAIGTSVSSGRLNFTLVSLSDTGTKTLTQSNIKLTNNGYIVGQSHTVWQLGSGIKISNSYYTSTFMATSITRLYITAQIANGIGIGSRFQLYKIGGA